MLRRPVLSIVIFLVAAPSGAITLNVPGDQPTIEAALDAAASGDSVVVDCGTYFEAGLTMWSPIVLCSATGDPACVTIDGNGVRILVADDLDVTAAIEGITFQNGVGTYGGAVSCTDSPLAFRDCRFEGCTANFGGAVALFSSVEPMGPTFAGCTFAGNNGAFWGGALWIGGPVVAVYDCVFTGNVAGSAAAIWAEGSGVKATIERSTFYGNRTLAVGDGVIQVEDGIVSIDRSIIAFGEQATAVRCDLGATALISCTDVFGNEQGDFVGCLAGLNGLNGNFSSDPIFCGAAAGDFTLDGTSPCLPGNHPYGAVCNTVGALGSGCTVVAAPAGVRASSWGRIKAAFRD